MFARHTHTDISLAVIMGDSFDAFYPPEGHTWENLTRWIDSELPFASYTRKVRIRKLIAERLDIS